MRITIEQVEKISRRILNNLKEKKLLVIKTPEDGVLKKIESVFLGDLRAEEALDREVEKIIDSHSLEMEGQQIDYRRMFNMVKGKLARERGIVI